MSEPNSFSFEGCTAKRDSGKALLVHIPDLDEDVWVPHSQIHEDSEVYGMGADETEGTLVVKKWFAEQRGWM